MTQLSIAQHSMAWHIVTLVDVGWHLSGLDVPRLHGQTTRHSMAQVSIAQHNTCVGLVDVGRHLSGLERVWLQSTPTRDMGHAQVSIAHLSTSVRFS
jgi:hypothetical protein